MDSRIVTLSENTAGLMPGILGEHGLSFYVGVRGHRLVFDCGQSFTAAYNAAALGIDLIGLPVALSHGHYDHTGGLMSVLSMTGTTRVYAHPGIFIRRYALRDGRARSVGLPWSRQALEDAGASFDLSREPKEIFEGVWLTGEVPRVTEFEGREDDLVLASGTPDPFEDDQALVLETPDGLVILLGCAHSGVINTIERAEEITGRDDLFALIGGTHLGFRGVDNPRLDGSIEALKEYDLKILSPCHCTGLRAAARLSSGFEGRFIFNAAGTIIQI